MNRVLFFIVVLFVSPLTWSVEAIKTGMTMALTGPVAELGVNIDIDENQHQAMHNVWMTHFKAGKITSFSWPMIQKQTTRR